MTLALCLWFTFGFLGAMVDYYRSGWTISEQTEVTLSEPQGPIIIALAILVASSAMLAGGPLTLGAALAVPRRR